MMHHPLGHRLSRSVLSMPTWLWRYQSLLSVLPGSFSKIGSYPTTHVFLLAETCPIWLAAASSEPRSRSHSERASFGLYDAPAQRTAAPVNREGSTDAALHALFPAPGRDIGRLPTCAAGAYMYCTIFGHVPGWFPRVISLSMSVSPPP